MDIEKRTIISKHTGIHHDNNHDDHSDKHEDKKYAKQSTVRQFSALHTKEGRKDYVRLWKQSLKDFRYGFSFALISAYNNYMYFTQTGPVSYRPVQFAIPLKDSKDRDSPKTEKKPSLLLWGSVLLGLGIGGAIFMFSILLLIPSFFLCCLIYPVYNAFWLIAWNPESAFWFAIIYGPPIGLFIVENLPFLNSTISKIFFTTLEKDDPKLASAILISGSNSSSPPTGRPSTFQTISSGTLTLRYNVKGFLSNFPKLFKLLIISFLLYIFKFLPFGFWLTQAIKFYLLNRLTRDIPSAFLLTVCAAIPGISDWTTTMLQVIFASRAVARDLLQPFFSQRRSLSYATRFLRRHSAFLLGLSLPWSMALSIPVVGPLFLGLATSSAASLLIVLLKKDEMEGHPDTFFPSSTWTISAPYLEPK